MQVAEITGQKNGSVKKLLEIHLHHISIKQRLQSYQKITYQIPRKQ